MVRPKATALIVAWTVAISMLGLAGGSPAWSNALEGVPAAASLAPASGRPPAGLGATRAANAQAVAAVVAGPDGRVWFTDKYIGIGAVESDGTVRTYHDDRPFSGGPGLTVGPDGALWATAPTNHAIVRVTTDGHFERFTDPVIDAPSDIAAGQDGNLWFTDPTNHGIGRLTPAGVTDFFTDPGIVDPNRIVAGPDDAMWFTDTGRCDGCDAGVGRIAADGTVTMVRDPDLVGPQGITVGADGNLWTANAGQCTWDASWPSPFPTACTNPSITRITPTGAVTAFTDTGLVSPVDLTSRTDGRLVVTDPGSGGLAGVELDGTLSVGLLKDRHPAIWGAVTATPDGSVWFVEYRELWSYYSSYATYQLTRLAPDGSTQEVLDQRLTDHQETTVGADGNLWFADGPIGGTAYPSDPSTLKRVDLTGLVTPIPTPPNLNITGLDGPAADGRLYFVWHVPGSSTDDGYGSVGTDGDIALVGEPGPDRIDGLSVSGDGAVWVKHSVNVGDPPTESQRLIRVDPNGGQQEIPLPVPFSGPLVPGPDGTTWFLASHDGHQWLTQAGPDGSITDLHTMDGYHRFTRTPDGAVWAWWSGPSDCDNPYNCVPPVEGSLDRLDEHGTAVAHVSTGGQVRDAVLGADGNLWWVGQSQLGDSFPLWIHATRPDGSAAIADRGPYDSGLERWYAFANRPPSIRGLTPAPDGTVWVAGSSGALSSITTGVGPPGPTSGVSAAPGAVGGGMDISWSAPTDDGGRPLTGYRVIASPGGGSCTATPPATTCTVDDLIAGADYTITVTATNAGFLSSTTGPVGPVRPPRAAGSGFTPVTPTRIGDTRTASNVGFSAGPIGAGTTKTLAIAGIDGVPPSARAIVATVTVTNPTAASYLTAYPTGAAVPGTANLLFAPGQTVAQSVTIPVGPDGTVSLFNQLGDVDVVVDLTGYYDDGTTPAGRLNATTPVRVLDSRTTDTTTNGPGQWDSQPLGPDQTRSLSLAGAVPATATAVVVNVTVTGGTDPSYLQALPGGGARPETATALFAPGQTVATLTTVGLGPDQTIDLYNQHGNVHVVADLVGWYDPTTGDLFHPITPRRLHDTRTTTPLDPAETRTLPATVDDLDTPALPADATALAGTLTATAGTDPSYLTAGPTPVPNPPGTASLLLAAGQTIPNSLLVATTTGVPGPTLDLYNQAGTAHAILDLTGYWAPT